MSMKACQMIYNWILGLSTYCAILGIYLPLSMAEFCIMFIIHIFIYKIKIENLNLIGLY